MGFEDFPRQDNVFGYVRVLAEVRARSVRIEAWARSVRIEAWARNVSPDHCGHFGLFRFSSDAILPFPEAKRCFTLPDMWLHCPQCIAIQYIFTCVTVLPSPQAIGFPNNFSSSAVPKPFFLGRTRQYKSTLMQSDAALMRHWHALTPRQSQVHEIFQ
jgi:hypothetical protein